MCARLAPPWRLRNFLSDLDPNQLHAGVQAALLGGLPRRRCLLLWALEHFFEVDPQVVRGQIALPAVVDVFEHAHGVETLEVLQFTLFGLQLCDFAHLFLDVLNDLGSECVELLRFGAFDFHFFSARLLDLSLLFMLRRKLLLLCNITSFQIFKEIILPLLVFNIYAMFAFDQIVLVMTLSLNRLLELAINLWLLELHFGFVLLNSLLFL